MAKASVSVDVVNDIILKKPLVFVQNEFGNDFTVYQDGKIVEGIRSISINAAYDGYTTHEIEYFTGKTETEGDD